MLRIVIPLSEVYDERKNEFATAEGLTVDLEHSLFSLSKWESKWEIPFLRDEKMTSEQLLDYIRMMCLGEIPADKDLIRLTDKEFGLINEYINSKQTATWFNERDEPKGRKEVVTAEIIYYWMVSLGIPFECQYWHLGRLLTLIKVCSYKNAPKKKMGRSEILSQQRDLNQLRRQQMGTTG